MNTDSCTTRPQSDTLSSILPGRMFALEVDGHAVYSRTEQVSGHDVTCVEHTSGKLVVFEEGSTIWPADLVAFSD